MDVRGIHGEVGRWVRLVQDCPVAVLEIAVLNL
jgi:hypothetical protein